MATTHSGNWTVSTYLRLSAISKDVYSLIGTISTLLLGRTQMTISNSVSKLQPWMHPQDWKRTWMYWWTKMSTYWSINCARSPSSGELQVQRTVVSNRVMGVGWRLVSKEKGRLIWLWWEKIRLFFICWHHHGLENLSQFCTCCKCLQRSKMSDKIIFVKTLNLRV